MQDTSYLRSQAELCLQTAHTVRDKKTAHSLRAAAANLLFPRFRR